MAKLRSWLGIRPIDIGITAAVAAAVELNVTVATGPNQAPLDALTYLFGTLIAIPILLRRRWPFEVLIACSVLLLVFYSVHRRDISPVPLLAFPVYDAATAGYLGWAIAIPAGYMTIGVMLAIFTTTERIARIATDFLPSIALLAVAAALGDNVRGRRALAVETAEKLRLAEEERVAEAGRAVAEERLRIARELHDTVAHAMATITVLAGTALHLTDLTADEAEAEDTGHGGNGSGGVRASLTSIRQTSKSALADMRVTLGTLRGTEADVADEQTRVAGLDRLDALVDAVRAAGAPVTVTVIGKRGPVPEQVDHAAYRILQESLTNVLRHAGQNASATVTLLYATDALTITIADDGVGAGSQEGEENGGTDAAGGGSGHGLIGMRERAAAVGGEVMAGPSAAGGFEVSARLPLAQASIAGGQR
ncbi:MAG TPA: histidine kinase [Streptosporangiaceae bacterium]|nr:histidine kinase [Streptosporangiaceae bacterium]